MNSGIKFRSTQTDALDMPPLEMCGNREGLHHLAQSGRDCQGMWTVGPQQHIQARPCPRTIRQAAAQRPPVCTACTGSLPSCNSLFRVSTASFEGPKLCRIVRSLGTDRVPRPETNGLAQLTPIVLWHRSSLGQPRSPDAVDSKREKALYITHLARHPD
jgi:hypothetical protein